MNIEIGIKLPSAPVSNLKVWSDDLPSGVSHLISVCILVLIALKCNHCRIGIVPALSGHP